MRVRRVLKLLVFGLAATMIAAAPPAAFCDDVTEINTGRTPVGNVDGLYQGVDAVPAHWWYSSERSVLGVAFISQAGAGYQVSAGLLNNGSYQDLGLESSGASISCPNPTQVAVSTSQSPEDPDKGNMTVAALCGNEVNITQIENLFLYGDPTDQPAWRRRELANPPTGILTASIGIRYDKEQDGVNPMTAVFLTNGTESVYGYDIDYGGSGTVQRQEYTFPPGQRGKWVIIDVTLDGGGRTHMVLTRTDGGMNYHMFQPGSTEADPDSYADLGSASPQTLFWNWPQVGVSQSGWLWASAYNGSEGAIYNFRKEPGSSHWLFGAATTSTGGMGMYNSMAVDNDYAYQTFADGANNVRTVTVSQSGEMNTQAFGPYDAPVYSTATAVGTNTGGPIIKDHIWFGMNKGRATFYRYRY